MLRVLFLLLLVGCAPAVFPLSEEELFSSNNLVWFAGVDEALVVTSSAIRAFDPAVGAVRVRQAGSIDNPDLVYELESTWLEAQGIAVLATRHGDKVGLAVVKRDSYSFNFEEGSVAARLRQALMAAMDNRFRRGQI